MKVGMKLGFLALALAVLFGGLWTYQLRLVNIPEDRTAFVVFFLIAAALGIAAFVRGPGWVGGIAAAIAIFIGTLIPFTIAISPQELTANALQVGDTIPHFTAIDDEGELFDSDSLQGHLVLIKFFRAHW